jgi:hypothetical protein
MGLLIALRIGQKVCLRTVLVEPVMGQIKLKCSQQVKLDRNPQNA